MSLLAGIGPLGVPELVIIAFIVVLVFGVGRLPEVGGAVGKGIREFRKASSQDDDPPQDSAASNSASPPPSASVSAGPPPDGGAAGADMMFCAECGTKNARSAKFCSSCGHTVSAGVS